jgi:hypothetical protein
LKRRIGVELVWAALTGALGLGVLLIVEALLHASRRAWSLGLYLDGTLGEWTYDRPGGWIALGLLAPAILYPTRALLALRRRDDPPSTIAHELRILAGCGAATSLIFLSTVIGSIHAQRVASRPPKLDVGVIFYGGPIAHELVMWSIVGAGLSMLAALWGLVGVAWARRGPRPAAMPIVAALGIATLVGVVGSALLRWWFVIPSLSSDTEWMVSARRYELILGTGEPLEQGRSALIVVAAIAAIGIVITLRRARPAASRELFAAAGLFVVGLAAFALTRAAAHDTLHPLPYWDGSAAGWLDDATFVSLPPGEKCTLSMQDQPTIVLTDDGRVRFNGSRAQGPIELQKTLEEQRDLWLQVQPGKRFPGRLEAVFAADAPMVLVAPIVEAALAAGYAGLDVIEAMPRRTYLTRTLGEVAYGPRVCHVPIRLDVALPRQGTWGDFARALPAPPPASPPAPIPSHERL